jgi:hypothetical protein
MSRPSKAEKIGNNRALREGNWVWNRQVTLFTKIGVQRSKRARADGLVAANSRERSPTRSNICAARDATTSGKSRWTSSLSARMQRFNPASVDQTEASYMPTDASVVENPRRPVAVHQKTHLDRRRSGSSEPIMSLIRAAQWAGEGARRRIESAGSESVTSRGSLSTTALLRATQERPDSVVAGQLPASRATAGNSWRRAVGRRSASPGFNGPTRAGRPAARPGGVGGRGRAPALRRGARSPACERGAGRVARRATGCRYGRGSG